MGLYESELSGLWAASSSYLGICVVVKDRTRFDSERWTSSLNDGLNVIMVRLLSNTIVNVSQTAIRRLNSSWCDERVLR